MCVEGAGKDDPAKQPGPPYRVLEIDTGSALFRQIEAEMRGAIGLHLRLANELGGPIDFWWWGRRTAHWRGNLGARQRDHNAVLAGQRSRTTIAEFQFEPA